MLHWLNWSDWFRFALKKKKKEKKNKTNTKENRNKISVFVYGRINNEKQQKKTVRKLKWINLRGQTSSREKQNKEEMNSTRYDELWLLLLLNKQTINK